MTTTPCTRTTSNPATAVGPWLIVQVLGRGGSSRVFKVERDGHPYSMKMALLPPHPSPRRSSRRSSTWRRRAPTGAWRARRRPSSPTPPTPTCCACTRWTSGPTPPRATPSSSPTSWTGTTGTSGAGASPLTPSGWWTPSPSVVRTVGVLHARGVYHRDLKAENILIRREDGRPFLIDFGTVRLPGALTKTLGLPEGVLHLVPPELLAYTRTEAWKRGEPFQGGVAADLYALGVLLYQGLTDLHPFDPELPDKELLAAIATVPPTAPHLLNPLVPRSLSDIAMKLLEKRPEDRYPDTEALLQALEKATEKERKSPAWKVPLTAPESPAEAPASRRTGAGGPAPGSSTRGRGGASPGGGAAVGGRSRGGSPHGARHVARGWPRHGGPAPPRGALFLLCGRSMLARTHMAESHASAPPEKGSAARAPAPPRPRTRLPPAAPRSRVLAAWLCTAAGLGCPAAQVRPEPEDCPPEARHTMFEELKLDEGMRLQAIVDINQPGDPYRGGHLPRRPHRRPRGAARGDCAATARRHRAVREALDGLWDSKP